MRPQASRQRSSQSRSLTHPTPAPGAGRNPCDLKLPVSAPANDGPHHSRHVPFTHPTPVLPLSSVIPAQTGIHATSSLPVSAPASRRPPTTRATLPAPTPPLGPAPLFRHSCAGRNPCDLKLPVSAPDQPTAPHHSRHAPCTLPSVPPLFPSFLRRQESMRPQASRQRPRSATAPTTHATLPSPTPPLGLAPPFRHSPVKSGAGSAQAGIHATSSFPSALQPTDGPPPLAPAPCTHGSCPSPSFLRGRNPCAQAPSAQRRPPPLRATLPAPTPPPPPARGREPPSVTP